jgi:hypothetical protein
MPGLGKKTFTAGDVLIAGDVNNYLMDQTVMNFATVAARSSAIPVPSTGMVSYVGDTGTDTATGATVVNVPQIQAYTGAAWQNVDGLTLVAKATITPGVSSVFVDNVFSADFDAYKIIITNYQLTVDTATLFRMGTSNTGYYQNQLATAGYSTVSGNVVFENIANGANWSVGTIGAATVKSGGSVEIQNPFTATPTTFQGLGSDPRTTGFSMRLSAGYHSVASSFTGFTILPTSGNFTSGTIKVYGYRSA